MGLGMFIAKTLLERSGAQLTFENGRRKGNAGWAGQATGGAIVTVKWGRNDSAVTVSDLSDGLGENQQFS